MIITCTGCDGDPVFPNGDICSTCQGACVLHVPDKKCTQCGVWRAGTRYPIQLLKREVHGAEFWYCPSCDGSYGPCK